MLSIATHIIAKDPANGSLLNIEDKWQRTFFTSFFRAVEEAVAPAMPGYRGRGDVSEDGVFSCVSTVAKLHGFIFKNDINIPIPM